MLTIRKLEKDLWEAADALRSNSKLTSNDYCMPVLGLIFLRYAYNRFLIVEEELMKDRPTRGGVALPVTSDDFKRKSALFLDEKARFNYLVNLPEGENIGKIIDDAMALIEKESEQLVGVLPNNYKNFDNSLLKEILRIFNNDNLNAVGGDVIGRIYEYFLNKFAQNVAQDDGVFFTPVSLVQMIVNVLEPKEGVVFDPACGSGGMFVQTGHFIKQKGIDTNSAITFYGQEKTEYNSKFARMNLAVHGLNGNIKVGNTFYVDEHSLNSKCDYVMANPPFNVNKVKSEKTLNAGRLPFGLPRVNQQEEISNGNYLWIQYFYSYLNENGRAGFVMAGPAADSGNKEREIRKKLIETGDVDVMISVGNNFFYTKSLPCSLWFFDKAKNENIKDKVLMIDARNTYHKVDRTLNMWTEYQLKNLKAIVCLYRGEKVKYVQLLEFYLNEANSYNNLLQEESEKLCDIYAIENISEWNNLIDKITDKMNNSEDILTTYSTKGLLKELVVESSKICKMILKRFEEADKEKTKELTEKIYNSSDIEKKITAIVKREIADRTTIYTTFLEEYIEVMKQAKWLTDKFGKGIYKDILGLCRIVDINEIAGKNYSISPGSYVGVSPIIDEDADNFEEIMINIQNKLVTLQSESNDLMDKISVNFEELDI